VLAAVLARSPVKVEQELEGQAESSVVLFCRVASDPSYPGDMIGDERGLYPTKLAKFPVCF
jgi:hypothetical protein